MAQVSHKKLFVAIQLPQIVFLNKTCTKREKSFTVVCIGLCVAVKTLNTLISIVDKQSIAIKGLSIPADKLIF